MQLVNEQALLPTLPCHNLDLPRSSRLIFTDRRTDDVFVVVAKYDEIRFLPMIYCMQRYKSVSQAKQLVSSAYTEV